MKDSFDRIIDYARISVTDLCNYRCRYCVPEEGIVPKKAHSEILRIEQLETIAESLISLGIKKIRLTGGEPLVRKGVDRFIKFLGGKKELQTLAITTNGSLLAQNINLLKSAGVNYINISLDTFDAEKYKQITRGGDIAAVMDSIDKVVAAGFAKIKINAVLMKGINDGEVRDFVAISEKHGIEVRFIELMPFCSQQDFAKKHYISADKIIVANPDFKYLGGIDGSTAEYYSTQNGGRIGFIRPISKKFCQDCNRIRITADGMLLTCLHNNKAYDLKPHIGANLTEYIRDCVLQKPQMHHLEENCFQDRNMKDIGG